jgi:cytochrome c-type biogenesis protein CcmH/NrfG
MGSTPKELKGYIKTENVILIVLVAVALGFIGGVAFSAYRTSGQSGTVPSLAQEASMPLTPQQSSQLNQLINMVNTNPQDLNAWTQLGHLYFDTDQPELAVDAYEKSLDLDANRPDVWTDLGVMYRRSNKPKKAIKAFDRALALNGRHEIALFNKGVVLMHDLKDAKGALASWEKLTGINPQAKTPGGQLVNELVDQLKQTPSS